MLKRLRELDAEINRRASERHHLSAESMEAPLPTPSELLQPDQALVQYFITRKWRADRDSIDPFVETRLYAIVWRSSKQPHLYYLGDPRDIVSQTQTRQIASLRSSRMRQERGAVPVDTLRDTFASLDSRLIAPLQGDLVGAETLFVIPDGQLFAVPFSLLQDSRERLLEQRYTTRMLTRPESLYGVTAQQTLPEEAMPCWPAASIIRTERRRRGAFAGTLKEVREIAEILKGRHFAPKMLVANEASEVAVRAAMERTDIAHLATHGAYASPKAGGQQGVDALWQSDVILSRSGDKRAMRRDESDGRLYAFELMTWNLSGLDLLVLSACETGRGEETFVGGLRGLPTAAASPAQSALC
jgi:CHAT domain-containing protein